MLAKTQIEELLKKADAGDKEGIGVVPSPLGFCEDQIGAASLDLRLGRWFLALHQSRRSELDLAAADARSLEASDGKYYYVPFNERFVIHPGRFVIAATLEWVRLPDSIGAYITGKSLLGRRGLVIETAAGIHPGFSGCIALEITNFGEVPIAVTPGMRVAQLFFHRTEGKTNVAPSKFSGVRKPVFGRYKLDFQEMQRQSELKF